MAERAPIPPKGQTGVEIEVVRVPHGADVVVRLRSLTLEMKGKPKSAMLFAWRALGVELEALGCNLPAVLAKSLKPIDREIEGDPNG